MRSGFGALLLAAVGTGCGSSAFRLEDALSCPVDYLDYGGGLTYSLLQGPGDGTFDYDPRGAVEARRFGKYFLDTGDFTFRIAYSDDSYMSEAVVSGFGYAATNGNLDVVATYEVTDQQDDSWSYQVRTERTGCKEVRIVLAGSGAVTTTEGTYGSDGFSYLRLVEPVEGGNYEVEGREAPDGSYEESVEISEGAYEYASTSEGDGDGYSFTEWAEEDSDYEMTGEVERFIDGSVRRSIVYEGDEGDYEQETEVDYAGNGEGTYTSGSTECDLEFDGGDCTYDCDNGESGDC